MLSLLERVRVLLFTCYSTIFNHWLRAKPSFTKCPKVIDLKFILQILLGLKGHGHFFGQILFF